jgi:membrane protein YdbS with pleckstrin-like domain
MKRVYPSMRGFMSILLTFLLIGAVGVACLFWFKRWLDHSRIAAQFTFMYQCMQAQLPADERDHMMLQLVSLRAAAKQDARIEGLSEKQADQLFMKAAIQQIAFALALERRLPTPVEQ